MAASAKRIGRPMKPPAPGARAPMSLLVRPQLKRRIEQLAERSGTTLAAEAERLLQTALNYERVLGDHQTALARLGQMRQGLREQILREDGFQRVTGLSGSVWFEPGVSPGKWIVDNANPEVIEEMLERAATLGAVKALQERKP
ncbi:MAG: hypothetical protein AUI16_21430 [Alphaproteobacteria bacterium 13_2_20CM_2_64_7]|jgi:hypothetical protein|nr:MAG: hypothetical protein AUI16_21430 [Alphaproteobacteria bacterium 13_2_20CM_2_64_7]